MGGTTTPVIFEQNIADANRSPHLKARVSAA